MLTLDGYLPKKNEPGLVSYIHGEKENYMDLTPDIRPGVDKHPSLSKT